MYSAISWILLGWYILSHTHNVSTHDIPIDTACPTPIFVILDKSMWEAKRPDDIPSEKFLNQGVDIRQRGFAANTNLAIRNECTAGEYRTH